MMLLGAGISNAGAPSGYSLLQRQIVAARVISCIGFVESHGLAGFHRFATLNTRETWSLHIGVRAFTAFGDETIESGGDNGQRYRAELEHGIVERADVEF